MPAYEASEAQSIFFELLDRAKRGEEVVITRNGKPVAELVAQTDETDENKRINETLAHLQRTRAMLKAQGVTFTTEEIRALRDEGRR